MRGSIAIALACVLGAASSAPAHADGVIRRRGREVRASPGHARHVHAACGGDPQACAPELVRAATGIAYGAVHAAAGDGGLVGVDAFSTELPFAVATAGRLDAAFVPAHGTARAALTLADLHALYSCRAEGGGLLAPVAGQMKHVCRSGVGLGVGGQLGQVDVDPRSGRVAVRWAEVRGQLELLGASSTAAYLRHHVEVALGASVDSVWHGDDDARRGSTHLVRGVVSLAAVQRSASGRWEASANAAWRPSLHDDGAELDAAVRRRMLTGPRTLVSIGLGVRATRWSDPDNAIGELVVPGHRGSLFAGLLFEVRHVSER